MRNVSFAPDGHATCACVTRPGPAAAAGPSSRQHHRGKRTRPLGKKKPQHFSDDEPTLPVSTPFSSNERNQWPLVLVER